MDHLRTQDSDASLNAIWVSHRPSRKVSGPLHEETNYGATDTPGILVRRKSISSLKETELSKIRDPEVAKAVTQFLGKEKRLYKSDFGKKLNEETEEAFGSSDSLTQEDIEQISEQKLHSTLTKKLKAKNPLQDAELGKLTLPSGIPIKKVRLLVANKAAVVLRERQPKELMIPGNTHHLTVFSLGDGKYHFETVTLLEASRRKRAKLPIIDKMQPADHPEAEFVMHLCYNETIRQKLSHYQME